MYRFPATDTMRVAYRRGRVRPDGGLLDLGEEAEQLALLAGGERCEDQLVFACVQRWQELVDDLLGVWGDVDEELAPVAGVRQAPDEAAPLEGVEQGRHAACGDEQAFGDHRRLQRLAGPLDDGQDLPGAGESWYWSRVCRLCSSISMVPARQRFAWHSVASALAPGYSSSKSSPTRIRGSGSPGGGPGPFPPAPGADPGVMRPGRGSGVRARRNRRRSPGGQAGWPPRRPEAASPSARYGSCSRGRRRPAAGTSTR